MFEADINNAIEALKKGKTILYPTDTVWGIGCDARNKDAVNKVFKIKQRPEYKSMVVMVCDENMLKRYVKEIPDAAKELLKSAEAPLTIIYPDGRMLAENVIAADNSIGIRVVKDDFCKALIQKFGKPIISTSANISGEDSPSSFKQIKLDILNAVDYIVTIKRNQETPTKPSTIIRVGLNNEIKILRK